MPFTFPLDKADFQAPNGISYTWDGLKWQTKSFRAPDSDVKVGDVPPEDPTPNVTLWFDTTDLELLLYYDDGDSAQWVPCSIPLTNSPEYKELEKKVSNLVLTEQAQQQAVSHLNKATLDQQRRLTEVETKVKEPLAKTEYVNDQDALRLLKSGDTLTGDIKLDKAGFVSNANSKIKYSSSDAHYFKGNVFFSDDKGDRKAKISSTNFDVYNLGRFKNGFVVKGPGQDIGGANSFAVYPECVTYTGEITHENHITNKNYVDRKNYGSMFRWVDPTTTIDKINDGEATVTSAGILLFANTDLDGRFAGSLRSKLAITTGLGFLYSINTYNKMSGFYESRNLYIAKEMRIGSGSRRHNEIIPLGGAVAVDPISIGDIVQLNVPGWL